MKTWNGLIAVLMLAATAALADDAPTLWTGKCKSCHAENGNGDTKVGREKKISDLSAAAWQAKHSDGQIRDVIKNGVPDTKMKAYADKLSDAEIDALVAHIRGFKK